MRRVLFKTVILCAAVFALSIAGNSQTIVCDGLTCPGSGNFSGAASCPPLDYMYRVTDPHPEVPESVYIGTDDGNLAHYKNVCLPAGWSFNIVSSQTVHFSPFRPHGSVLTPNGACPFYLSFSGLMSPGSVYIGFNHNRVPHEVSWELGTLGANVLANWSDAVASGTGPVHGPFACDSTGTIYYGDGDCNVDGNVLTVADMAYLNAFLHGSVAPPSALYHSDLNGDCVVDSNDYKLYQNYFTFGISVFAPYGGYPVPTCCSVGVVIYPGDSLSDLCGMKFEDIDCDGIKDPVEPPIPGWPISLYQGATQIGLTILTDANGAYCFLDKTPGTYQVREAYPPGWIQTYPPTVAHTVALLPNQVIQNLDFGNTRDTCEPPSVLEFVDKVAGVKDNFSLVNGPEPSSPGADMAGLCGGNANYFFDSPQINNCFGHTFTGFNHQDSCCVIDAVLCLRITPSDAGSPNDGISIIENGVYCWGLSLSTLWWYHTGGLDSTWNAGDTLDTCLNLANLPPGTADAGGIGTNVMATLHDGDFSVRFQDDTKIDFLELRVTLCCPRKENDSLGVCCLPDGSCVPAVTGNQCEAMQGTFTLGGSCFPNPCPPPDSGVCCYQGSCVQVPTSGYCDSLTGGLGTFIPNGSCFPNPCPPVPDSCQTFTVKCCDGKPIVAQRRNIPNFRGQVAVASWYADPTNPGDGPFVVGIVDLTNQCTAQTGTVPVATGYSPPMFHNEHFRPAPYNSANLTNDPLDEWTRANLGTVFGLCLDTLGNIFVAQTSCYNVDDFSNTASVFFTGGDVYKLDGATGKVTRIVTLPNSGQGLGDVSYQCRGDRLFVSDMENGLIYTINNVSSAVPTMGITFDHGAGLPSPINDDGLTGTPNSNTGFTALGRRIWALQAVTGVLGIQPFSRLYYSVWWEDFGNVKLSNQNEIWSVELSLVSGDIVAGTQQLEIKLPPFPGSSTSGPVSDISFTTDGHMILAERTMTGASSAGAHSSRLLSYKCENGLWTREVTGSAYPNDDIYRILYAGSYPSCAGGTDYDAKTGYPATCVAGRVWATADALRYPSPAIYGLAGFPRTGGNSSNNSDCILIDLDAQTTDVDKTELGDVEIPCRHCRGTRGDVNGDLADANILDLTYMVDRIFRGGPAPLDLEEADVSGDGSINILDLTFLVDRIFRGGLAPGPCPSCCTVPCPTCSTH